MVSTVYFDTSALVKRYIAEVGSDWVRALLDVQSPIVFTARQMANLHPLRAYDAVQLATAWSLNQDLVNDGESPLTFICADDRLLAVAQAEGLHTDNPNHHP